MKVELEYAYVLHSRPFKDTSLLVDFLTENYGRVTLIAKGARQQKKKGNFLLQPFASLKISWQGRGQLKTLISTEVAFHTVVFNRAVDSTLGSRVHKNLEGSYLYSGFYANELLTYLLPYEEPNADTFYTYVNLLTALKEKSDLEMTLRLFELSFLSELGYGIDFTVAAATNDFIALDKQYYYKPGEGFFDIEKLDENLKNNLLNARNTFFGSVILAINSHEYAQQSVRQAAKYICRKSIDHILMGKTIKSRELFR